MAFLAVFQALCPGLADLRMACSDVPERARIFREKRNVHPGLPRCPRVSSLTTPTLPLPQLCANVDVIPHLCRAVFGLCGRVTLGRGPLASGPRLVLGPDSGMVDPARPDDPSADLATMGGTRVAANLGSLTAIPRLGRGPELASPRGCLGAYRDGIGLAGMAAFMAGHPTSSSGLAIRSDVGWTHVTRPMASHGMPTRPGSAAAVGSDDGNGPSER